MRIWGILLVGAVVFLAFLLVRDGAERRELADLRETDPSRYIELTKEKLTTDEWMTELRDLDAQRWLVELRTLKGDRAWYRALREVDPAAYEVETKRLEEEKRAKQEELAKKREAERERLANLRQTDPQAYLKEIEGRTNFMSELRELDREAYFRRMEEERAKKRREEMAKSDLHLVNWTWRRDYSYATARGVVKNLRREPIKNLQAVLLMYDGNGNFISSDTALVEYDPVLPGQESPFRVMVRWNPAMQKGKVEFKEFWGAKLRTYDE